MPCRYLGGRKVSRGLRGSAFDGHPYAGLAASGARWPVRIDCADATASSLSRLVRHAVAEFPSDHDLDCALIVLMCLCDFKSGSKVADS